MQVGEGINSMGVESLDAILEKNVFNSGEIEMKEEFTIKSVATDLQSWFDTLDYN